MTSGRLKLANHLSDRFKAIEEILPTVEVFRQVVKSNKNNFGLEIHINSTLMSPSMAIMLLDKYEEILKIERFYVDDELKSL